MKRLIAYFFIVVGVVGFTRPAFAIDQVHDEIQVYNADITGVGQWTYEQHANYAAVGQTQPEFPGGFTSNRSLQGTPEFAYGITNWWEGGFYLPFAVASNGELLSDGAKIRSLFVVPDAAKRNFFYGVNFELGCELPPFAPSPWALEIRPIIGVRNAQWEFIVNPIVDVSFGSAGEADFAPAMRLARNLGEDRFVGLEYYSDFSKSAISCRCKNKASNCLLLPTSSSTRWMLNSALADGLTPGSDRLVFKAIIGYAFPVPGRSDSNGSSPNVPLAMGTSARSSQNPLIVK